MNLGELMMLVQKYFLGEINADITSCQMTVLTEVLPPREGSRGRRGEGFVAGGRLVVVVVLLMWILIHVIVL